MFREEFNVCVCVCVVCVYIYIFSYLFTIIYSHIYIYIPLHTLVPHVFCYFCFLFIGHLNIDPDFLYFIRYDTTNSHRCHPCYCLLTDYRNIYDSASPLSFIPERCKETGKKDGIASYNKDHINR